MRRMRRIVRPAILVLAASLALVAAPVARAAGPVVQHVTVENEPDPGLTAQFSAICGFQVEATITGRYSVIQWTTSSGVRRTLQLQSLLFTFTNPATGESVTVRNAFQTNATLTPTGETTAQGQLLQGGLNFLYLQQDQTWASAGRREVVALLTLDAQGNVIGSVVTLDQRTQNLASLGSLVCPLLAA